MLKTKTVGSRSTFTYVLIILLVAGLLSGCMHKHSHVPFDAKSYKYIEVKKEHSDPFAYDRKAVPLKNRTFNNLEDENYKVRYLRFPSVGINGQKDNLFTAMYYQSKKKGRQKLVIVMPIWGSYTYPSRKIARGVLDRSHGNTSVIYVIGKNHLFDWEGMGAAMTVAAFEKILRENVERYRTHVIDTRRLIDWVEKQPEVDPNRIGLVGFSMSALVASSVISSDKRIASGVLVMGGAEPHKIFATCWGKVGFLRDRITKRFGWSVAKYQQVFKIAFDRVQNFHFDGYIDPRKVIMFDASRDDCMPTSSRDTLWLAMGKPERFSFKYTHRKAFMAMTPLGGFFMRRRIYEFLDRTL